MVENRKKFVSLLVPNQLYYKYFFFFVRECVWNKASQNDIGNDRKLAVVIFQNNDFRNVRSVVKTNLIFFHCFYYYDIIVLFTFSIHLKSRHPFLFVSLNMRVFECRRFRSVHPTTAAIHKWPIHVHALRRSLTTSP